jgi:biopolymer transport protein ExbD
MAEIIADEGGKKKGKKRAKKHGTHIDMTPMVDLACLLLTFFMLTTAFSKPKVMEIVLPERQKDKKNQTEISKGRVLNIILTSDDKIFWYNGLADPHKPPLPTLNVTDFSKDGIRKVVLERNKNLFARIDSLNRGIIEGTSTTPKDSIKSVIKRMKREDNERKIGPIILIKSDENVKYKDFVSIIDEMAITDVAIYSVSDLMPVEKKMIADFRAGNTGTATKPN